MVVLNFNTSHVTVYLHRIHTKKCLLCNFNTSHVTVYHYSVEICQAGRKISIHPMLRFIRYIPSNCSSSCEFQYIPCYGLSEWPPFLFSVLHYFNTSHVTVYPGWQDFLQLSLFHFNTSHVTVYLPVLMPLFPLIGSFQYIPCYGLSQYFLDCVNHRWHFNTSHVTVYPFRSRTLEVLLCYFNTSHVTVYRSQQEHVGGKCQFQYIPCYGLSYSGGEYEYIAEAFQYIPCYGLSGVNKSM